MALLLNGTSSFQYAPGPPPFVPITPDYGICDRRYGSHLMPLLCGWARETLTQGDSPISYTVGGRTRGPQVLPHTAVFGNCKIWVEVAGPTTPAIYEAIPDEIRGMAAWLIDQCVGGSRSGYGGYGGFATKDISRLIDYVTNPDTKISDTYPASSAFLTVTITGPWDQSIQPPSPGNYDPSIAQHLAQAELDAWNAAAPGSSLRQDLAIRQQFFTRQSMRMRTAGSSVTWWDSSPRAAISET